MTKPAFPTGSSTITDYVVAATNADRLYVSNGRSVMSSVDGGCRWKTSLTLVAVPGETVGQEITHLAMSPRDPNRVYAALGTELASKPSIMVTTDGGETWSTADRGLETVQGRPIQLTVAPGEPRAAYLVIEGNRISQGDKAASVVKSLYATTDGSTWSERTASPLLVEGEVRPVPGGPAVGGNGSFQGVAVDPLSSSVVWLYGGFGLWRSTDGARTSSRFVASRPDPDGGPIGAVDLYHTSSVNRILAFDSLRQRAYASFNGGARFHHVPTPGIVRSAATGRSFAEVVVATDARIYYLADPSTPSRHITPPGPAVGDLSTAFRTTPVFHARSATTLLRWTTAPRKPRPEDRVPAAPTISGPGQVTVPQLPPLPPTRLTGAPTVALAAGESRTVPYELDLPGVQRVDVFFLIDVSDSMSQEINGLRSALAGIITELVASNINAHFGVARYNTYNTEPYFRLTPVTAPGPTLEKALEDLVASGGGTAKTQLEALLQSATGAGRNDGDVFVPRGQDARFRAEAPVKLVLHATDEGFFEGAPSPSFDTVNAALRSRGIKQIGLALDNGDILPSLGPGPEAGLRRVAIGSGALAPPGGVDCDADATADIAAGEPLVCLMPSERSGEAALLANAIVNLVKSLPNDGSVRVDVTAADRAAPAPVIGLNTFAVDFKSTTKRFVEVTYTCPTSSTESSFGYTVTASSNDAPLASLNTVLTCGAIAVPPVLAAIPPAAAAAVAPPVQPPPVSNANPNPNPNPQSQVQAQAQGAPQAAMALQEETQPQFAYAYVNPAGAGAAQPAAAESRGRTTDYAMSRYDPTESDASVRLVGGIAAGTMAAAYGAAVAVRRRAQTHLVPARARRRG